MDKNSIIGFILILLVVIGFSFLNRPSEEEIAAQQAYQDSVMLAESTAHAMELQQQKQAKEMEAAQDSTTRDSICGEKYGEFAQAAQGEAKLVRLENEKIALGISTKGGCFEEAEIKGYYYHDSLPLMLFQGDEQSLNFALVANGSRVINTKDLYFEPQPIEKKADGSQVLRMRLETTGKAYMDFVYTLKKDDYMVDMEVVPVDMVQVVPLSSNYMEMEWDAQVAQQEKGRQFEERYARLSYKEHGEDKAEELSENKSDEEQGLNNLHWIAFRDQYFSTVLIAKGQLNKTDLSSEPLKTTGYIKHYNAKSEIAFDPTGKKTTAFTWYIGPNNYNQLKAYNDLAKDGEDELNLQSIVYLGYRWCAWVNRWGTVPLFALFSKWFSNYGLIILLITLVMKTVIFPFTYKSYLSSAKMRVLRPEMDAAVADIPEDDMQRRQQAQMAIYQKAGVNPMSGCLPMLLQMPIVLAMFSFFPAAVELRGQSFLWAHDLSSYDAILEWDANIPLISWAFDNHLSLWCILMTITNIVYTKINMASQPTNSAMPGMNVMMYMMPVFFLFFFNNYAAGLSYYYFLSLLITIIQNVVLRYTIDDEKLLKQLKDKSKKNEGKKKSGLMARLEEMQKEQQRIARENAKQRSKR